MTVERRETNAEKTPALRTLFGLERLPLAPCRVSVEVRGVPTAVINALRRVVTDEMPGHALKVPPDGFKSELTSELFMTPQFVNGRIELLRLRPQIPADVAATLRLKLDVTNSTATLMMVHAGDLQVSAGSMPEALFNPTTPLAFLQPGMRIVIDGIYVSTGYGRDHGMYNVASLAAYTHLDLEQYSDAEQREEDGPAVDLSGYKASCLVADPKHHRLTATIPATTPDTAEVRAIFADACANVKERLRLIATTVERRAESSSAGFAHRGVQFTVVQLEGGVSEGILQIPGETYTIGELVRRTVFDLTPELVNVTYVIVAHENKLVLTIRHTEDVVRVLSRAIQFAIGTFDELQRGVMGAPMAAVGAE